MSGTLRISGHEFPERPPDRSGGAGRVRKYVEMLNALEYAAEQCGEVDRTLYKSIRECQAFALNLLKRARLDAGADLSASLAQSSPPLPFEL